MTVKQLALAILIASLVAVPARAHPTREFTACARYRPRAQRCFLTARFLGGQAVYLKGVVKPPHRHLEAGVWREKPDQIHWRRVAKVPISDTGRMRWTWLTTHHSVVLDAPYRFRFKIGGHGRSNVVSVWVIAGE